MIRLTIFIIVLLLLAGGIEPSQPWFIALAVLSGLELVRARPLRWCGRALRGTFGGGRRRWAEDFDW
jgi:hypothetical protein